MPANALIHLMEPGVRGGSGSPLVSIEGAGTYRLGSNALTVGLNNLSTEVSGSVVGMCGVEAPVLVGANFYTQIYPSWNAIPRFFQVRTTWQRLENEWQLLAPIQQDDLSGELPSVLNLTRNVNVIHARATSNETGLIGEILGTEALTRFSELRNIEAGWNFGEGLPMSSAAESNFFLLLSRLPEKVPNPRLFLMDDGAIELQWRNSLNERVSVVSTDDHFELFAPNADEARFALTDYQKLIEAAFGPSVGA